MTGLWNRLFPDASFTNRKSTSIFSGRQLELECDYEETPPQQWKVITDYWQSKNEELTPS